MGNRAPTCVSAAAEGDSAGSRNGRGRRSERGTEEPGGEGRGPEAAGRRRLSWTPAASPLPPAGEDVTLGGAEGCDSRVGAGCPE